ncbi:helix-turn-helix transcriptional regulator [Tessaracoccus sp. MC1627]|uniref:helix-turn-helix domain-containing protein n=1 Tax=Tessaracoccus sp. MC1627 TaxID=2760312 RepID=UPI0016006011|nr:helix-turn-helix transcriptional regulator [Tessaracoccus sp. MC1627]MBB1512022.1 helix-turn-helix transcriptional regulator [Tessaracoccus sp. MC1627]
MPKQHPDLEVQWDRVQVMRQLRDLQDDRALITAMGMSHASYSRVKSGKQRPGTRFIAALCVALNVNVNDICVIDETGHPRTAKAA